MKTENLIQCPYIDSGHQLVMDEATTKTEDNISPDPKKNPKSKRRKRTTFNEEQLSVLEEAFDMQQYPGPLYLENLADSIGIPDIAVKVSMRALH